MDLFERGPAAPNQIPNGQDQSAGGSGHSQLDRAFARQKLFAPLGQRMGGTQNGLGRFDEQAAQVFASVSSDASAPLFFTAVVKGGVKANIFDQLAWVGKTLDVPKDGSQGKGDLIANATEPHHGQKERVG